MQILSHCWFTVLENDRQQHSLPVSGVVVFVGGILYLSVSFIQIFTVRVKIADKPRDMGVAVVMWVLCLLLSATAFSVIILALMPDHMTDLMS